MARIISPSMLLADFGHLDRDTRMIDESAAQWVHIDIMDGVFVPNISFGFPVLEAIRKATDKFLDVHLMIVDPMKYAKRFAEAGAQLVTIHYEALGNIREALEEIRSYGVMSGVSIKPATPVSVLEGILDVTDVVLIMSVEPGFGGQGFIEGSVEKVRELRAMIDKAGTGTLIEIDGGVSAANSEMLFEAGCDALVAGSAVFSAPDPKAEIVKILNGR